MEKKAWRIMMKTLYAAASDEERHALSRAICTRLAAHLLPSLRNVRAQEASLENGEGRRENGEGRREKWVESRENWLAAYFPRVDEPDIRPFLLAWLEAGGRLCLPRCITRDDGTPVLSFHAVKNLTEGISAGPYGLQEPDAILPEVRPEVIALVLVPGVAFDRTGGRLGRGKGYYDRFLSRCPQAEKVAAAFPWQVVDRVPMAPHDMRIDEIVTPMAVIRCTQVI